MMMMTMTTTRTATTCLQWEPNTILHLMFARIFLIVFFHWNYAAFSVFVLIRVRHNTQYTSNAVVVRIAHAARAFSRFFFFVVVAVIVCLSFHCFHRFTRPAYESPSKQIENATTEYKRQEEKFPFRTTGEKRWKMFCVCEMCACVHLAQSKTQMFVSFSLYLCAMNSHSHKHSLMLYERKNGLYAQWSFSLFLCTSFDCSAFFFVAYNSSTSRWILRFHQYTNVTCLVRLVSHRLVRISIRAVCCLFENLLCFLRSAILRSSVWCVSDTKLGYGARVFFFHCTPAQSYWWCLTFLVIL